MTDNNQWGAGVNYIVLAVLYCTLEVHFMYTSCMIDNMLSQTDSKRIHFTVIKRKNVSAANHAMVKPIWVCTSGTFY